MTMIPKKIHYCWFGGNPLTQLAKDCIESWKKYCPDYEIVEWNETNIDIDSSPFMKSAYENKKWAFVSDYARYKIIYENGGVYLDVDVEVIKSLDDLLDYGAYMGFEGNEYVNSGLGFGAKAGDAMLEEILAVYDKTSYEDHKNEPAKISTPIIVTDILSKHGFKKNGELQTVGSVTILPEDYLCPKNPITRLTNITENSHSIHHYDASWVDSSEREYIDKLEELSKDVALRFPDLISIIIPVYNGEDYLAQAIDSAINQTYKNLEVIVVDDGSSDKTEEIARQYGARIRYIKKPNGGVSSALNVGIKNMRGKYFAWLSHDDVYHIKKLEILHKAVAGSSNVIPISNWDIIDENSSYIRSYKLDQRLETVPKGFLAFDRTTWLNACAMLIPKSLFDTVGNFAENLRTTQDYDMHLRMMEAGARYRIVHESLLYSRAHSKQGSLVVTDDTLINSDRMHVKIINCLSKNEYELYFRNELSEFEAAYKSFKSNGYSATPAAMVGRVVDLYNKNDSFTKSVINRFLLSYDLIAPQARVNSTLLHLKAKKTKPRILFCSGHWLTGGMERVMSNLFEHLNDLYDIYLITPGSFDSKASAIPITEKVKHLILDDKLYNDSFDIVAFTYAKILDIDVVVGFLNLNDLQLSLYEHCVNSDIRTIASNHEYYFFPYRSPDPDMRRLALRRKQVYSKISATLWLTNFNVQVGKIDSSNSFLMPNPNTFSAKRHLKKKDEIKNIICVGRFNDHVKRIDRIIRVFGLYQKENSDAKLTIVGSLDFDLPTADTKGRSTNELIEDYEINKKSIKYINESKDMEKYYSEADLIILASETEGFPMVLTEAMCHGVPAVCFDIPGVEDIVIDGYNGYVLSQDDIKGMSDRISLMAKDVSELNKLSSNALSHVQQFSGDKIAMRWVNLINTVISDEIKNTDIDKYLPHLSQSPVLFNKRLINELDEATKQSIIMAKRYMIDSKETKIAKIVRLAKATRRDYETMGVKRASKKAVKKVIRKISSKLNLDKR